MRKQYKSSKSKNKKIQLFFFFFFFFMGVPLKGYVASQVILDLAPELKNSIVGISSD